MHGIEIETKLELCESEYRTLCNVGEVKKSVEQLNVYYDWRWTLAGAGCTFRIRFAQGREPVVTLKVPLSFREATRTATEIEGLASDLFGSRLFIRAPQEIFVATLPINYAATLDGIGISRLRRVGWTRNQRLVISIPDRGCFELDRLQLPDHTVVFEVEIEHQDQDAHTLVELIKQHAPSAQPSHSSKFERFFYASQMAKFAFSSKTGKYERILKF
jgi:uncharacterized protein YjbK